MSELDEKLKDILTAYRLSSKYDDFVDTTDSTVELINQAFKDAGYVQPLPKIEDGTLYPLIWAKANGYKTGAEWRARLNTELRAEFDSTIIGTVSETVDELLKRVNKAAKRASGLDTEW